MVDPWSTPGGMLPGSTPMATTRPVPDFSTAETGSNSPAAIGLTMVMPIGDADPAGRYRAALSPRLTSTAVGSPAPSTVPPARLRSAAHTAVVCVLAPITRAPSTTAAMISRIPPTNRKFNHFGRAMRRGVGAGGTATRRPPPSCDAPADNLRSRSLSYGTLLRGKLHHHLPSSVKSSRWEASVGEEE